jgi:peptide/nickel transport system substrate-binding protein
MSMTILGGCAEPPRTATARTLRFALSEPVATLQPPSLRGLADQQLLRLLYDGLTRTDVEGRIAPGLASRWESADGSTWTFTVPRGRTFHDGTPITPNDVVRSWTALGAYRDKAPIAPLLEDIDGMAAVLAGEATAVSGLSVPDDTTLVVRLRRPLVAFPIVISRPEYAVVAAASTPQRPVGSGRWRWVSGAPDDSLLVLARVDSTLVAKADTLELRVVPSPTVATAMAAGRLDCVSQILPSQRTSFAMQPSLSIINTAPAAMARLVLRGSLPALRDSRVRAALSHALDLASIARSTGEVAVSIEGRRLPVVLAGGVPSRQPPTYDPALARRLLHEAGADSLRLRIARLPYAIAGDTIRDFIYRVRDYWAAVGIRVEIVQPKDFWRAIADSSADAQPQYYFNGVPDGPEYMARAYMSGSPLNRFGPPIAGAARIDGLLDSARATTNSETRRRLLTDADDLLAAQVPEVLLWHVPLVNAKRTSVPSCTVGLYTDDQLRGEVQTR